MYNLQTNMRERRTKERKLVTTQKKTAKEGKKAK